MLKKLCIMGASVYGLAAGIFLVFDHSWLCIACCCCATILVKAADIIADNERRRRGKS